MLHTDEGHKIGRNMTVNNNNMDMEHAYKRGFVVSLCNTVDIHRCMMDTTCCIYSNGLLMMNSQSIRNM